MNDPVQFEAYSYRVSSRFGGRIWIEVGEHEIRVCGPRLGGGVYCLWIGVQVIVFWVSIPVILAAFILGNGRLFLLALGIIFVHWVISSMGAGCLWELENLMAYFNRSKGKTATFSRGDVKRVKIGRGWARKGLWLAIPIYVPLVNRAAKESVVSFEAPDGEKGKLVVYALHMRAKEDASSLAALLAAVN
jgi:hypothetical protein